MAENWLELVIIVVILLGIAAAIFRGGAANPESTGSLRRKFDRVQAELVGIKRDVDVISSRVAEVDRRAATIDDIRGLEKKLEDQGHSISQLSATVAEVREASAARHATLDHVRDQVDRLYDFIVKRGMEK